MDAVAPKPALSSRKPKPKRQPRFVVTLVDTKLQDLAVEALFQLDPWRSLALAYREILMADGGKPRLRRATPAALRRLCRAAAALIKLGIDPDTGRALNQPRKPGKAGQ